ncbi:glycosyltransferase family 39 protein [Sorangium sp. So ce375]|uniref:ArnT family glycosyltransferase n=1 Tax=Sorangium sp. So ce375 TaxID=3133306 RepID=UPI003F5C9D1A
MARPAQAERRWLSAAIPGALFALALAVRLVFVSRYHSPEDFVFSDMWVHDHRARNLLSGSLSAWDTFTPVGYPALLALVYRLGGTAQTVGLLQAVLGALTVVATWQLARRVFPGWVPALCVGVATALHVPAVFYTGFLLTETPFSFLVLAGAWALVVSIERRSLLGLSICGLLWGVGATVRPNLLAFLPFVPLILWLGSGRRWRDTAVATLVLAGAFAVPVQAAAAHNARIVGTPTLGTNGGLNFYLNFASVRGVLFRDQVGQHRITPIPNLLYYPSDEWVKVPFYVDAHYYRRGLGLVRKEPARLGVTGRNLTEAAGVGRQGYWPGNDQEPWLRAQRQAFFYLAIVPSLLGIALLARRRRFATRSVLPLTMAAALVLSSMVTVLFFLGAPRMRVPFDPLLILLAAAAYVWGLEALKRRIEARRQGRAAPPAPA